MNGQAIRLAVRAVCLASILILTCAFGASAQQLLSNPGFESWSGTTTGDYWIQYNTTGTVTCYKGTTFTGTPSVSAHGGTQWQRVKIAGSGYQGGVYQRFASTPGTQYTVSAYLLTRITSTTQAEAKLGVDPTGATAPGANTSWSSTVTGDSAWTLRTLTVTATGSYITVFLNGRHPTTDASQCNVFFDDASATAVACTPPNPPTGGTATANSISQITWGWTRASGASGETYRGYDASTGGNLKWTSASQATSFAEGSLSTNTLYGSGAGAGNQRHLATFQTCESSTRLTLPAKYTLQAAATTPTFGTIATSSIVLNTTGPANLTAGSSGVIFKRNGTTDLTKVQALTTTDSGLSTNTQYSYTARGVNGDNVATAESSSASKYTAQANATTPTFGTVTISSIVLNTTGPVNLASGSSGVIFKRNGTTDLTKVQALTTTDSGISANTSYSYTARGVNGDGTSSTESSSASEYTLVKAPAYGTSGDVTVQCDHGSSNSGCTPSESLTFTFNNAFGSGQANVGKFTYVWDTNATWNGTGGTDWTSGATLVRQVGGVGSTYYLHLASWNNDSPMVENATVLNLGPYTVSGSSSLLNGNFESWSGSVTADNWTQYNSVGTCAPSKGSTWAGTPSVSPHGGSECHRVKTDAYNEQGGVYQRFSTTPGTQYTVSVWIETRIGSAYEIEGRLGVDPTGATAPSGNTIWSDAVVGDSGWVQKTINATAAGSYMTVFLDNRHPHYDASGNSAFFDDASATINGCSQPSVPTSPAATPSSICFGSASVLSASVAGGCTVDWYSGSCYGQFVGSGTSLGVTPLSTTTYYARARNTSTGCESACAAGVTVTVNTAPSVPTSPAANPTTIAAGQSSTLSATVAGGCTVDWYSGSCGGTLVGSGTSLSVSPTTTTTYYARARNTTTGCTNLTCAAPVTVTVSGTAGILNGGFESWSGTTVANNWTQYVTTGSITCYKGSTFSGTPAVSPHGGSESQRVKIAGYNYEGGVYQRFSSAVGTQYTVTAYLLTRLTNATQAQAKLGVDPTGATTPGANTSWSSVVSGDSSWTAKTLNVTATGSYMTIFLDGKHPTNDTNQCNIFFDDVSLSAPPVPATRYIKPHVGGTHDGTSWANAFDEVGDALAVSASGDELWVASGTYVENLVVPSGVAVYGGFAGTETARSQRNWISNITVLDGGSADSVVEIARSATSSTRIDGFTITNGRAVLGGGIHINQSAYPVITNNIVTGNRADAYGGGIFSNLSSSPVIAANKITSNSALFDGGGIRTESGSPTIADNVIAFNAGGTGAGICAGDGSVTSTEYIINNTIFGNSGNYGAGIYLLAMSSAHVSNNIIAYNTNGIRKGSGSGVPVLKKNDLYANTGYNYSGLSAGANDIASNPLLASSTYGQVHIQPTSPCKDNGDNAEVVAGYLDMDNQTRIQNTTVDIGADESDGTTWTVSPVTVRVSTSGSDSYDGSTWANAKRNIQSAIDAAAAGGGGEVWVKAGTYYESVDLLDSVYVYGGFNGTETTRSQRNWTTNVTTINGGAAAPAAEAISLGNQLSALDGFTLTNGAAWQGAGFFCLSAAPQVMNNTITANAARGSGGGVFLGNSAGLIKVNSIINNSALVYGGGVACLRGMAEISRDNIEDNWACISGCGAYVSGSSTCKFVNNRIVRNHQNSSFPGAWGGALATDSYSAPTFICNTIADNSASYGAVYSGEYSNYTFNSNIVAFNGTGGMLCGLGGTLTRYNNDVYGNSSYNYSGMGSGVGDISSDPLFHNRTGGDYRQNSGSPVINAADQASAPTDDYLGVTRSTADMGCYEWQAVWGFSARGSDLINENAALAEAEQVSSAMQFALGRRDAPTTNEVVLYTGWPASAESMNLYVSADGANWQPSEVEVKRGEANLDLAYGTARLPLTESAYFAFTAVNEGGESRPGPVIHARPTEVEFGGVAIDKPLAGETNVPVVPALAWHPSWLQQARLSYYLCGIDRWADNGRRLVWLVRTTKTPPQESLVYSQNASVVTLLTASRPLAEYSRYLFSVLAVDKENWAFAVSPDVPFTTGRSTAPQR